MQHEKMSKTDSVTKGYVILTRKGNIYNWEMFSNKQVADNYLEHLKGLGFDAIITTNEIELTIYK